MDLPVVIIMTVCILMALCDGKTCKSQKRQE